MHFSIPDTQEFVDNTGSSYLGYNIHINGLYHCTVRYKQLLNLHEQLVKDLDMTLPSFPPKKFFPLTPNQQEDRRLGLEKYIQTIGQNSMINNCELLNGYLLYAQQESNGRFMEDENFEVFLMNGQSINIKISTGDNSTNVLKKICQHINLPEKYYSYFSLFIIIEGENKNINILRRLQDFESPLLTQSNIDYVGIKVVIGKNYWNIDNDFNLMENSIALNLLYIQAIAELNSGWIIVPKKLQSQINDAQEHDDKCKYLKLIHPLKFYGYVQFATCFCDYPKIGTKVLVAIGRNELSLRIISNNDEQHEAVFKVTRMRCWRITTMHNYTDKKDNNITECSLELSFEYLVAKKQLQWITISSEQAILMSVCLQSMIDELLLKHHVGGSKLPDVINKSWIYIMRDGHSRINIGPNAPDNIDKVQKNRQDNETNKSEAVIKKITDKFTNIKHKKITVDAKVTGRFNRASTSNCDIMENNAFHMIGDEDL
ncbi:hypothetical protein PV325_000470 [Microctonus aethiopoides]|uniref:PX domain-containing protein n=1 Tax=Microctonus aethiopoides TaxID=144406 RepID=A0AA39KKE3_9HYME|nr:hypothetical protein PV325_000470 [Microctonus aethiopoides]KAK0092065.1 hypothetical protein PV326_002276 [Microctonus aethiopoides]KAK0164576.1 hypothetical protein PV328_003191 [Microctonus aethiopoides]